MKYKMIFILPMFWLNNLYGGSPNLNELPLGRISSMNRDDIIRALDLKPLPGEGGFYKETYRGSSSLPACSLLMQDIAGNRNIGTAIYYLVDELNFSALHKLRADEVFHFYGGSPVEMLQIFPDGSAKTFVLGPNVLQGQHVQILVPAGVWQGLRLLKPSSGDWALMGTTMAIGFDFADFEIGERVKLVAAFPKHGDLIAKFTRD